MLVQAFLFLSTNPIKLNGVAAAMVGCFVTWQRIAMFLLLFDLVDKPLFVPTVMRNLKRWITLGICICLVVTILYKVNLFYKRYE